MTKDDKHNVLGSGRRKKPSLGQKEGEGFTTILSQRRTRKALYQRKKPAPRLQVKVMATKGQTAKKCQVNIPDGFKKIAFCKPPPIKVPQRATGQLQSRSSLIMVDLPQKRILGHDFDSASGDHHTGPVEHPASKISRYLGPCSQQGLGIVFGPRVLDNLSWIAPFLSPIWVYIE